MNLAFIFDSKKDYADLATKGPDNFYFALASKLSKFIVPPAKRDNKQVSFKILGNPVEVKYSPSDIVVTIDGKQFSGGDSGLKGLEKVVYDAFQAELKGDISINRPSGNSMLNDRNQFNKASGTMFTKLYQSVTRDAEGNVNADVKGSRNYTPVLTERQFENAKAVPTFKSENFKKVIEGGMTFYVNKRVDSVSIDGLIDIPEHKDSPEHPPVQEFERILSNDDRYMEYWSRTPGLYKLGENIEKFITTVVVYKDAAWVIIPKQNDFYIKRFI